MHTAANCQLNSVVVEFIEGWSVDQVVTEIHSHLSPQVLLWYIGPYGLKEKAVHFYRDSIITPSLDKNKNTTFWLTDLTAWGAFKHSQRAIHESSAVCEMIEACLDSRIRCIRSSKILQKMKDLSDVELIDYFKSILNRESVHRASKGFPPTNICIQDIFSHHCPMIPDWYNYDVSKAYSAFQYIEGCLIVDEIFVDLSLKHKDTSSEVVIIFALPNDELKYYQHEQSSFQRDVSFLISKRCNELKIKKSKLIIKFVSFNYGSSTRNRPYNAPSKTMEALSLEEIVGKKEQATLSSRRVL